jgi:hypothetical protein
MNELPSGVQVLVAGYGETPSPQVLRDEMDRGPVNQELINSRMRWTMSVTFLMESKAALDALLVWYRDTIKVIGYFTLNHPRTGKPIQARLVEGKLGTISPLAPGFRASSVSVELEYYL